MELLLSLGCNFLRLLQYLSPTLVFYQQPEIKKSFDKHYELNLLNKIIKFDSCFISNMFEYCVILVVHVTTGWGQGMMCNRCE